MGMTFEQFEYKLSELRDKCIRFQDNGNCNNTNCQKCAYQSVCNMWRMLDGKMTDYQKYINALRKCAKEHENDKGFTGHIIVSDLCRDTANLLETIEQEPFDNRPCISSGVCEHDKQKVLDKVRAEITDCLKALDEIEKSGLNIYLPNEISGRRLTYQQCLEFIDKYKAESAKKMGMTFNNLCNSCTNVEAISKADYENRLKADLEAILVEIQLEIEEKEQYYQDKFLESKNAVHDAAMGGRMFGCGECKDLIQEKIDKLKGGNEPIKCAASDEEIAKSFIEDVEAVKDQLPTTKNNLAVDCISREQAKSAIRDKFKDLPSRVEINTILNELPSATPQPRKGHWIRITNGAMKEKYFCSECGRQIEDDGIEGLLPIKYPYCHCGAKMVEPQESEEKHD